MDDKLGKPLQESLLASLAYNDTHGGIVANMVQPSYFDGDYAQIAARCIEYHHKYKAAPGRHIDDLFADIFGKPDDNRAVTYRQILIDLLFLHQEGLNGKYLTDMVTLFLREQRIKQATIDTADRMAARGHLAIEEVEELWYRVLRERTNTTTPAMRLTEVDRLLSYLEQQHSEFKTGIEVLDKRHITPARGTAMLTLGATGTGKSWWLIHLGRLAMQMRHKVLHVTLEMSEEQVTQRYLQSMFTAASRDVRTTVTRMLSERGDNDRFPRLQPNQEMLGEFSLRGAYAREEIVSRLQWIGGKAENLLIKRFPSGKLSVEELAAYLDTIALTERFVPDMLIVDYLGLMRIDKGGKTEFRHSLGRNLIDLRGEAQARNMALVTAQQASREGARSRQVDMIHVAEDWSLNGTADCVLTLSATNQEKAFGLCRLFVSKGRDERDRFGLVLTQNLALGQFAVDVRHHHAGPYNDRLQELGQQDGHDDSEEGAATEDDT